MFTQRIPGLAALVSVTLAVSSASAQTGAVTGPLVNPPGVGTPVIDPIGVATGRLASTERPAIGAPAGAAAIHVPEQQSRWPHAYVVGRGGLTFATRTAPLLGTEVGGQVAPLLQVYGSFDWHRDISPSFIEDLGELISEIVDADVNYRLPSFIGMGGLKAIAPRGTIRPYGLGGVGYGRVNGTVEVEGDDVTNLLDEFGYLDRDDISFNKMLFEVGGGISASTGRMYMDIGYRFRKFLQTGEPINMSGVYAGVGVGF